MTDPETRRATKLTWAKVAMIRRYTESVPVLAARLRVDRSTIYSVRSNKTWKVATPKVPPLGWPAHWSLDSAANQMRYGAWRDALLWQYTPTRTARILAGADRASVADLAKWRQLGEGR